MGRTKSKKIFKLCKALILKHMNCSSLISNNRLRISVLADVMFQFFKDHSDSCDDTESYLVEVDFDAIPDESERMCLYSIPTSFALFAENVDKL